jgi:hypothetical protein
MAYCVGTVTVVGVPEIDPVAASIASPAGRAGVMAKLAICPPVDEIVYPLVNELPTVAISDVLSMTRIGADGLIVSR